MAQKLYINIHPPIVAQVELKGENLLISTDSGMVIYQWYKNDIPIEGANDQFYSIPTGIDRGGSYHVELESDYRCKGKSDYIVIGNQILKLYPNPVISHLTIEFSNDETGIGIVEIKDLNGKMIFSKTYNKKTISKKLDISLPYFMNGIYQINIYLNEKFLYSEKIIKN